MKPTLVLLGLLVAPLLHAAPLEPEVASALREKLSPHPRLFLTRRDEPAFRKKLQSGKLDKLQAEIIAQADRALPLPPVQRKLEGIRLVGESRECIKRVLNLSMAWRITREARYKERAIAELKAVAAFSDWNPAHFLDVAEMTIGVAIGYDWLHAELDDATRALLRDAIIQKGLKPSLTGKHWWIHGTNNWNQVCHGGMILGALAVAEQEPALAASLIARGIENLPHALKGYEPDGAYPEGPGYWNYGTIYNVLLIAGLQSALGTDFGLSQNAAFLKSAEYMIHITGPSGYFHNYADCGLGSEGAINPALFWFARERKAPWLLWFDLPKLGKTKAQDRFNPLLMVWADPGIEAKAPDRLDWAAHGPAPVAFFRSGWTRKDLFVGIKGGSPSTSHAHMDGGSFVFDADGERWIHDLGMQNYHELETHKITLWNYKQDSQRWKVFRLSNLSHSTLVFNGQLQKVTGMASISTQGLHQESPQAVVDCSSLYEGSAEKVLRTFTLKQRKLLLVEDQITKVAQSGTVRWQVLTKADVTVAGTRALLRQNGKTLQVENASSTPVNWAVIDVSAPKEVYDCPNPQAKLLVLDLPVGSGDSPRFLVKLIPEP